MKIKILDVRFSLAGKMATGAIIAFCALASAVQADEVPSVPLFMTQHAPVGAWSSLTFGLPGEGVGIENENPAVDPAGDLVVACSYGAGKTTVLPFLKESRTTDHEGHPAGNGAAAGFRKWHVVNSTDLHRTLTPSIDEFKASNITLRVISPRFPLAPPETRQGWDLALLPAVLIEVQIDNTDQDVEARGFLGISYKGSGRIRAADWSDAHLVGIGLRDKWALEALADGNQVFTIRSGSISSPFEEGRAEIHPGGNEGGICFRVHPHEKRTLVAACGFYYAGRQATQGLISTRFAYTDRYADVESVCRATLQNADAIRQAARAYDEKLTPAKSDPLIAQLFAQATQSYYANSSLVETEPGKIWWSICEGAFCWRNTMDLAADQLPFELTVHPWVAENVIDGFIENYSYRDKVRFEGEKDAAHPGGISFAHDQGNYTAYAPAGTGGYEQPNRQGIYSFMTSEELLNGIYCASACALRQSDSTWSKQHLPIAQQLLESLENREAAAAPDRRGILSAQSEKVGKGAEITTYDALDHSLQSSRGNIYIVVKTWCAALLLQQWFENEGDDAYGERAAALAKRTADSLQNGFLGDQGRFPPNLIEGGDAVISVALEPLAVPIYCHLDKKMGAFPILIEDLRLHALTCLKTGACIDGKTGGLKLSSTSDNTWPSKAALVIAVSQWLTGENIREIAPPVLPELGRWMQVSAAATTTADQINATTGAVTGGTYYPRVVTLQMLLPSPGNSASPSR